MDITEQELDRLERLCMLEISGDSRERLRGQISRIIGFVDQLQTVDTRGYEDDSAEDGPPTPLRPDREAGCIDRTVVLSEAPDTSDGMFRVPGIIPGSKEGR